MRNDAIIDGVIPRKGLWIVNRALGKTYGQIVFVKKDGTVVWLGSLKVRVRADPERLIKAGCTYAEEPLTENQTS